MSVATVITDGYGTFGSVAFVITDGYSIGVAEQPLVKREVDSLPPPPNQQPIGEADGKSIKTHYVWQDWFFRLQQKVNSAITAASAQFAILFKDEGTDLGSTGTVESVNFTGANVTASRVGNAVTVDVSLPVASQILVDNIAGSTYTQLQQFINVMHSPGLITGGLITDAGGGSINISAGTMMIRAVDDDVSSLKFANFSNTVIAIPGDGATRFVGVKYNAGSPIVEIRSSESWDKDTEFALGSAANVSSTLFIINNPFKTGDPITNIIQRFDALSFFQRDNTVGGLTLGETGTRNITVSAGRIWLRLNDITVASKNTSGSDTMGSVHWNGSTWIITQGLTQWPNTQYNDQTLGLVTMGNNKYANLWFYIFASGTTIAFAYGSAEYNSAATAAEESPPGFQVTPNWGANTLLIGRLIFQKNAATAFAIQSAFATIFTAVATTIHNDLAGLQGGAAGEFYHLTAEQNVLFTDGNVMQKNSVAAGATVTIPSGYVLGLLAGGMDNEGTIDNSGNFATD